MVETFFTEKRIIKKIITVLVFIFMFNFTFAHLGNNVVFAAPQTKEVAEVEEDYELIEGGGKLLLPIHSLVLWIADAIMEMMQKSFMSSTPIIQKAKAAELSEFNTGAAVLCVVAVVVLALATIYTCGAAAAAAPTVTGAMTAATAAGTSAAVAGITAAGTVAGQIAGGVVVTGVSLTVAVVELDEFISGILGEFDLPMILYTPEAIFSNRVPLFDINFFKPSDGIVEEKTVNLETDPDKKIQWDTTKWGGGTIEIDNKVLREALKNFKRNNFSQVGESRSQWTTTSLDEDIIKILKRDIGKDVKTTGGLMTESRCLFVMSKAGNPEPGTGVSTDTAVARNDVGHLAHNAYWMQMFFWYSPSEEAFYQYEIVDVDGGRLGRTLEA